MLLTNQERGKFALYCDNCAETAKGMAGQMEKLSGPVMVELVKRENLKVAAFSIVAAELRSAESMTL